MKINLASLQKFTEAMSQLMQYLIGVPQTKTQFDKLKSGRYEELNFKIRNSALSITLIPLSLDSI